MLHIMEDGNTNKTEKPDQISSTPAFHAQQFLGLDRKYNSFSPFNFLKSWLKNILMWQIILFFSSWKKPKWDYSGRARWLALQKSHQFFKPLEKDLGTVKKDKHAQSGFLAKVKCTKLWSWKTLPSCWLTLKVNQANALLTFFFFTLNT